MRPFGGGAPVDWLIVGLGNPGREHADTRHNVGFMVADQLAELWGLSRPKDRFRGRIAEGRVKSATPGATGASPGATGAASEATGATGAASGVTGAASGATGALAGSVGAPAGGGPRVAVLWPLTFMNDAGRSVGPARGALKLPLERVLVIHDEIDLPFGDIRTRLGGGLAGHNGLKSIKRELGSADFMRVRVGVGRPASTDPEIVSAHVLGRFREPPVEVDDLIDHAREAVERVVLDQGE